VRSAWPFGIDLSCLPPAAGDQHRPGRRLSAPPNRRLKVEVREYGLVHMFNKPFRSTICTRTAPMGERSNLRKLLRRIIAWHGGALKAYARALETADDALAPKRFLDVCVRHSTRELGCAQREEQILYERLNMTWSSQIGSLKGLYSILYPFRYSAKQRCPALEPSGRAHGPQIKTATG
jgi:hypothetical protein